MAMKGRIEEYTSAVREAERGAGALRELVALVEVEETLAWSNGSSEREALEGLRALAAGGAPLPPRLMEVVAKEFVARNGFKMESEGQGRELLEQLVVAAQNGAAAAAAITTLAETAELVPTGGSSSGGFAQSGGGALAASVPRWRRTIG